jgi:hypothetical protein
MLVDKMIITVYLELLLQNPVSTFIILLLILLTNDVELNPGPTTEGELSIFHLNTRSMRHKLDYIESICFDIKKMFFEKPRMRIEVKMTYGSAV